MTTQSRFPITYFDCHLPNNPVVDAEESLLARCAIICGEKQSGKSSLAFQYAISSACRGEAVLYCVNQKAMQSRPPRPEMSLHELPDHVLGLIEFVYIDSFEGACQALATIGTEASCCDFLPRHIIVEEAELEPQRDARAVTALLACLSNTIDALCDALGADSKGLFVSEHPIPVSTMAAYPYAVLPVWVRVAVEAHRGVAEASSASTHRVTITTVCRGVHTEKFDFEMLFAMDAERYQVTSHLSKIEAR